jgi:response regulator NasT
MSRSLRIVVADDDPAFHAIYRKLLTALGHEVIGVASTGRELIECCLAQRPELVITDIKMDDLDGIDAARELCASEALPIIFVSGYFDAELIERAQADYVLGYLVKPIKQADLETSIAIAMRRFEEYQVLRMEAQHYRESLASRKILERAKGILMKKARLSEAEAFKRLQDLAQRQDRKLIEIAETIVTAEELLQ